MNALGSCMQALRDNVSLLEETSQLLDGPYLLENLVVAMKQLTDPAQFNVRQSVVAPLSDLMEQVLADQSGITFMVPCVCGQRYHTVDEADLCYQLHEREANLYGRPVDREGGGAVEPVRRRKRQGFDFFKESTTDLKPPLVDLGQLNVDYFHEHGPGGNTPGTDDDLPGGEAPGVGPDVPQEEGNR